MNADSSVAGATVLHRLPVGWKLVGLSLFCAAAMTLHSPAVLAGLCLAAFSACVVAQLPMATVRPVVTGLLFAGAAILAFHATSGTLLLGIRSVLGLAATVLAASLVTATSSTSSMIGAFEIALAPLARVGIYPRRPAVMLALALRYIPFFVEELKAMQQARVARGARGLSVALAAPLVIAALRTGDELAEALEARGFGAESLDHPQGGLHHDIT